MRVDEYLKSKVPGIPLEDEVIKGAAISPIFAKPEKLKAIKASDDISDLAEDESFAKSLDYAISTLYYAVSGIIDGGSYSEQIDDVKISAGGVSMTQADRDYYRGLADKIRIRLGCNLEDDPNEDNGMFDATNLGYEVH